MPNAADSNSNLLEGRQPGFVHAWPQLHVPETPFGTADFLSESPETRHHCAQKFVDAAWEHPCKSPMHMRLHTAFKRKQVAGPSAGQL